MTTCETWDKSLTLKPVPIIVTSYHRPKTFNRCLYSLINTTNCPIYVIDNSEDGLDIELQHISNSPRVTIIKNITNIGKPASIRTHWDRIPKSPWFITMDPDIIVPIGGINQLINDANRLRQLGYLIGIMAPALTENKICWKSQIETKTLIMHEYKNMYEIEKSIYYNQRLAGCLMLVNTMLYNHIGGFQSSKLYNDDDGWLCNQSLNNGLLNLINSRVICEHDSSEEDAGYLAWKSRNATQQTDLSGYWDQLSHRIIH